MKINWTFRASKTYTKIIGFILDNWTKKEIDLLLFWDNRQDPEKLKY
jgi:hypothetical protein